jgi:basic amino acid/polyamine antiporter, APA family
MVAVDISSSQPGLRKELNLFDIAAIVVGTIIGSGIFLLPSFIAAQLNSLAAVMLVWAVGGILTVFGALSLAELSSIYPGAGGLCTYLRHAYGPLPAFLYAWGLLLMIHSGTIAALAVAFGLYAGQILPLNTAKEKMLSAVCILALTTVNCLGIRGGKRVQNLIAIAKISGLSVIIILLAVKGSRPMHLFKTSANTSGSPAFSLAGFGVALVAVLWAYEAWHVVSFVAGEVKRPKLDLPRGLFYGTAFVMLVYLAANLGYYHVLSPAEIRGSNAVAALAVGKLLGATARSLISLLILISILGSMNGMILTGPRVYYAMARDGIFPRVFGRISDQYRTPTLALIVQGAWAAVLAVSGSYQQLFTDVIFTAWIFYGLAVAAVVVLRHTQPQLDRPFCVPGYPWVPLLFCTAATGLVLNTAIEQPGGALIGLGLVATGMPVYLVSVRSSTSRG